MIKINEFWLTVRNLSGLLSLCGFQHQPTVEDYYHI